MMVKKKQEHGNTFTRFTWICLETDQTLILKASVSGREMSQENKLYLIPVTRFQDFLSLRCICVKINLAFKLTCCIYEVDKLFGRDSGCFAFFEG